MSMSLPILKTIDATFPKPDGKAINVKFTDGTEALAFDNTEFFAPLEGGVEALAVFETKTSKSTGLQFDVITQWGAIPQDTLSTDEMRSTLEELNKPEPVIGNPISEKPKAEKAKPVSVNFEARELSIIAQVALKEAVPYAAQQIALGGKKNLATPKAVVKIAREFMAGMLEMVADAKGGNL